MFVEACEEARLITHPVVTNLRRLNGEIEAGVMAFVTLNSDGWIITAGHLLDPLACATERVGEGT